MERVVKRVVQIYTCTVRGCATVSSLPFPLRRQLTALFVNDPLHGLEESNDTYDTTTGNDAVSLSGVGKRSLPSRSTSE
jgi:hypothetical protein